MANKRLKKKHQQKQTVSLLERAGLGKKEVKTYKNKPQQVAKLPQVKKIVAKEARNERARLRNKELSSLGFSTKDISKMRYWGENKYQEAIKKKQKAIRQKERRKQKAKEQKTSHSGGLKLLILWKDVTDNVGDEFLGDVLQDNQYKVYGDLVEDSKFFMNQTFGEIGQYTNLLIREDELNNTLRMYPGWTKVYFGNGKQYQKLLTKINFMMLALYQDYTKYLFMTDVIDKMSIINMKTAKRLAKDFDIQF